MKNTTRENFFAASGSGSVGISIPFREFGIVSGHAERPLMVGGSKVLSGPHVQLVHSRFVRLVIPTLIPNGTNQRKAPMP